MDTERYLGFHLDLEPLTLAEARELEAVLRPIVTKINAAMMAEGLPTAATVRGTPDAPVEIPDPDDAFQEFLAAVLDAEGRAIRTIPVQRGEFNA